MPDFCWTLKIDTSITAIQLESFLFCYTIMNDVFFDENIDTVMYAMIARCIDQVF
jgi:hypothetical protein